MLGRLRPESALVFFSFTLEFYQLTNAKIHDPMDVSGISARERRMSGSS
jgi:hypothetical protein